METKLNIPQIKICGITTPAQAGQCADLGADAIGCVFFAKSPRNLSDKQAEEICAAVAGNIQTVGVFVNASYEAIMEKVDFCGLSCVQLHGAEPPELVTRLRRQGLIVIKALFGSRPPNLNAAPLYQTASAFLAECGSGVLPGGNAKTWNWADTGPVARQGPLVLAGGLSPENIAEALLAALPDAVDVSSGVEAAPGIKDMDKIALFINNIKQTVSGTSPGKPLRRIF
ncbi:MAG: phosphoribosylanthranilate isomerase [Thermodesulfobacteriota bacterium]|nr:phosphoribosylanthranilate isomerase [Thermodesulfobacteriota bacterium]